MANDFNGFNTFLILYIVCIVLRCSAFLLGFRSESNPRHVHLVTATSKFSQIF